MVCRHGDRIEIYADRNRQKGGCSDSRDLPGCSMGRLFPRSLARLAMSLSTPYLVQAGIAHDLKRPTLEAT